jgi:hypothetical protein
MRQIFQVPKFKETELWTEQLLQDGYCVIRDAIPVPWLRS